MGFGSNSERSSKTGKEKAQLSHADPRLKNQIQSTSFETNASRDCKGEPLKGKLTKEDEPVRYMSNLPGYLQRVDSSDNLLEKALNFGVLDWGRLQKWKSDQKRIPTINGNDLSSTGIGLASKTDAKSAFFSSVPKVASMSRSKQQSSTCSSLSSSRKDGIPRGAKLSTPKARHYRDIETASKNTLDQQKKSSKTYKSFSKSFPYDLLQKDHFRELHPEVPHSCKFPSGPEMNPETDMMARGLEPSSDASLFSNYTGNIRYQRKHSAESKTRPQEADVDTLKILEEEMAELASERSRTSSPSRLLSFSLRRLSRSFSFKESSAVPRLKSDYVSVRSGSVRSHSSGFLGKLNGHNRTRSSPFRRMLDPLLKSKGINSFRSTDTVQPSKGSSNSSTPRKVNTNEFFQEEKLGPSKIKALLEVAMKNGLPLFRFVVNNGSNMLATTMKSLASSDKKGTDHNYVFSSVSEIKKSGSWISKGNKEKNCGYIYNIIGQMKILNSRFSDLTAEDSCNHYLVREFVLFSVEQRQADQASAKFTPSTELAAVVIKIPGENSVQHGDGFSESLAMDGCTCKSTENPSSKSTTVILPGGVHTLPNKGIPSPLIDRWRFDGLCDCGGWDVGCKLHILSDQNSKRCKNSACLDPDRFELFPQGEAQRNTPIFSLVPHRKAIYAIEFSSSVTALQVFFISVTVISCRKSSDLSEFGNLQEGKVIKEAMLNGSLGMDDKPTIILGTMPAKYAPNPLHSPVGRV